MGSVL